MGIREDLNLVGNDFSNLATFLFVGLLAFEIPNSRCDISCFFNCTHSNIHGHI